MALLYGGGNEVTDCGSGSSIDNLTQCTMLCWTYPNFLNNYTGFAGKLDGSGDNGSWFHFNDSPNGYLDFGKHRATTVLQARSSSNGLTTGKWWFIGGQFDTGGAASAQKLFVGDLATKVVEVSSYSTQTAGSGSVDDDSAQNFVIGGFSNTGIGGGLGGGIAHFGMWNRLLSLSEIEDQQFRPRPTNGCVLFSRQGWNGTGSQFDYSGNGNDGTVSSGPTVMDDPPLRVWTPMHGRFPASAAPAGAVIPIFMHQYRRRYA